MRLVPILALFLAALCLANTGCSRKTKLGGAGATFPAILYEQWCKDFTKSKDVQVEYQKTGSGKGEQMIVEGTVDFAGSDAPNPEKLREKVGDKGLVFVPTTAGSIVLTFNVEGLDKLKLSQEAVAGIFLGDIQKWNDPLIKKHNPDAKLPDKDITVITRLDKSGTSEIFTGFLSAVSPTFKDKVGKSKEPNFPLPKERGIKAEGNDKVMGQIKQTPNSIGYVEYGYAKTSGKPMAWLQNKDGEFIEPTIKSAQASLEVIELPETLVGFDLNPKGKDSYPIVSYTWMMVYKKYSDAKKAEAIKDFLKYCVHEGQAKSEELGYIPLPPSVVSKAEKAIEQISN